MKKLTTFLLATLFAATVFQACTEGSPGLEYMPDMYRSEAVEPYTEKVGTEDGLSALHPVEGTVPQGYMPYPYPNTADGYKAATTDWKSPLPMNEDLVMEGKIIYGKFCIHCHGKNGQGQGTVPTNSEYPSPPAYDGIADLTEGKMFHTLTYGKGLMGSHASQLTAEERWKVIQYVQTFLGEGDSEIEEAEAPTAAEKPAETEMAENTK